MAAIFAACALANSDRLAATAVPPAARVVAEATRPPVPVPGPTPSASPAATPAATAAPSPTPGPTACGETRGRISGELLRSAALGRDETYRVYTPACYARQTFRRYPAIYLLHGGEHNEEHWDEIGVDEAADRLIAAGAIPPLLIVLPDGGQDFGPLRGSPPPFARYLRDELIPHIDASFRTEPDRAGRAIGGISYGGAWALLLAARYANTFGAVGAHSPAIGTYNGIYPDANAIVAGGLRVYIDVGDRDGLRKPAAAMADALARAGRAPEFHVYPGRHVEAYWNSHLEEYLRFYAQDWQPVGASS